MHSKSLPRRSSIHLFFGFDAVVAIGLWGNLQSSSFVYVWTGWYRLQVVAGSFAPTEDKNGFSCPSRQRSRFSSPLPRRNQTTASKCSRSRRLRLPALQLPRFDQLWCHTPSRAGHGVSSLRVLPAPLSRTRMNDGRRSLPHSPSRPSALLPATNKRQQNPGGQVFLEGTSSTPAARRHVRPATRERHHRRRSKRHRTRRTPAAAHAAEKQPPVPPPTPPPPE